MKSKLTILLGMILLSAAASFGQTAEPTKAAPSVKLPTAQEVLAKYVKAIGGREGIEKIRSWTSKGTVELAPMGVKGTFEVLSSAPDRSLMKMTLAGVGDFVEGFDGKTAWSVNPLQGSREKTGDELLQTKLSNNFYREINIDKLYKKLEVTGIEKVNGKDAYVVKGEPEGLPPSTMYFDVASGLLVRTDNTSISPEGRQPVTVFIEEYKPFDGVMQPARVRTKLPTADLILTISEMKSGPQADEAKFAKPKAQ